MRGAKCTVCDPGPSPAYLKRLEATFGEPLLFPPKEILTRLHDGGYSDPNHLHEPGRELYSQRLGTQLRQRPDRAGPADCPPSDTSSCAPS